MKLASLREVLKAPERQKDRSIAKVWDHAPMGINCQEMDITSLKGCLPKMEFVNCARNDLKDLVGGPKEVDSYFRCMNNDLTSLKGAPERVGQDFNCSQNDLLTSLEGAPKYIGEDFICKYTKIGNGSLHNVHKHLPEIHGAFIAISCGITSHVLGLLKIKGLQSAHFFEESHGAGHDAMRATTIVNNHLASNRNILECQEELIDAGLEAFAQL